VQQGKREHLSDEGRTLFDFSDFSAASEVGSILAGRVILSFAQRAKASEESNDLVIPLPTRFRVNGPYSPV
jgi:hypothetical protein